MTQAEPYVVYRLDAYGRRQYVFRQLYPVDCRAPIRCKGIAAQGWVNSLPKAKTIQAKRQQLRPLKQSQTQPGTGWMQCG